MNFVERAQSGLGVLHRQKVDDAHLVAGVLGAPRDVDRVLEWQGVAEDYQPRFTMCGGAAHLLGVIELV